MSEHCCICGSKLGFGSGAKTVQGLDGYYLCQWCVNKMQDFSGDSEQDKRTAALFFANRIESGSIDPTVVNWLHTYFPNIQEYDAQRKAKIAQQKAAEEAIEEERERQISFVTSGWNFEGYRIVSYHGPISGNVVMELDFSRGSPLAFLILQGRLLKALRKRCQRQRILRWNG